MKISQACFNTSLMGAIRGVADYMNIDISTSELYGRSGHAFMLNIHEAICPSGPYCWNIDPFIHLLKNCGIKMNKLGFFSLDSSPEERTTLEGILKDELHRGNPISMVNMDYQLITGFDETGFICAQPWEMDYPPAHLTFGSWAELKDEIHACFYSFEKVEVATSSFSFTESLKFVKDLHANPQNYTLSPYTAGLAAYDGWISGIEKGYGREQGNWWNGIVWSECRKQAALYFDGMAVESLDNVRDLLELKKLYNDIGDILLKVSDKELGDSKKIDLLFEAKSLETQTLKKIDGLLSLIS